MTTTDEKLSPRSSPAIQSTGGLPTWVSALLPLVLLAGLLAFFAFGNPLALFRANLPPVEDLAIQPVRVTNSGFEFDVVNTGPTPVTIAQLIVDAAFWEFTITPSPTIERFGTATISLVYPWVLAEPNTILVMTSTGVTFEHVVEVATLTPQPGLREFAAYGLLGVYVGILPVGLGLLWFPAMRKLGRRGLGAILAFTIGLLIFLLVDTLLEALEVGAAVAGVFQGIPLALFAALITWLALMAIGARTSRQGATPAQQRLYVATLIALGIGLHNLGEGLAIGTAFALGEAALGSFLVIGFTLHNVTEGVGIAAPVTRDRPSLKQFIGLGLLAGAPAILGAWIGGFTTSPVLAVVFLGIGTGAIWQVIVEVGNLLKRDAERDGVPMVSWLNVGALVAGIGVMYLTAFLVH
jgi:ZIP family zinc transporter